MENLSSSTYKYCCRSQ